MDVNFIIKFYIVHKLRNMIVMIILVMAFYNFTRHCQY